MAARKDPARAPARGRSRTSIIRTAAAPPPVGAYPHARRLGGLLFLSGVGPRRPGTGEIPGVTRDASGRIVAHDIRVQTRAAIDNVGRILEEAGSSLDRVVDVTVFLVDMARDFAAYNEVWAERFGAIQPARTTVQVGALPTPIAVELKVIAAA
jgi:2-aminomuconate deaminase